MSSARDFPGDYSPGGLNAKAKARVNGRRGGLASGRKRRQLSPGRRPARRRTRTEALSLNYPHRQLTRAKFCAVYEILRPRPVQHGPAIAQWLKGRESGLMVYRQNFRRYRARGQHYGTTNGQGQRALELAHRPRCRRQVQRIHRILEEMGLMAFSHAKNGGEKAGERDFLVVEIRTSSQHVTLPAQGQGGEPPYGLGSPPPADKALEKRAENGTGSLPPPTAADAEPPAEPAETTVDQRAEWRAAIALLEAKIASGWDSPKIRLRLSYFRRELAALDQAALFEVPSSGQSSSRSVATTSAGFR